MSSFRPDECNGSYQQYCDETRQYKNITQILEQFNRYDLLDYMAVYWKDERGNDESFWEHEWGKHGTCISTFDTSCYTDHVPTQEVVDYFQKTLQLFSVLDTYSFLKDAGIVPSATKTYTYAEIRKALVQDRHVNATIECSGANSTELDEVYYYYNVYGSAQDGTYIPAQPGESALGALASFDLLLTIADSNSSSCPMTGIHYLPKNLTSTPKQNGTYKFL